MLLGLFFIPFFIVPQLDWLFWGWFKCFLQYSFYQVVAAAVIYIIGNILTSFMTIYNGQPIPIPAMSADHTAHHRRYLFRLHAAEGASAHEPHL